MANEFYVAPAGDISQGLSGLSAVLADVGERKREREQQEAAEAARQQRELDMSRAFRSGDALTVAETAARYPEMSENIYRSMGAINDEQKEQTKDWMRTVLSSPERAPELLAERVADLRAVGNEQAAATAEQALMEMQQGPEAAQEVLNRLELGYGAIAGPGELQMYQAQREQADQPNYQRVSAVVRGEDSPTSLNFNPATGVYSRQMPDGSIQNIPSSQVTQVSIQGGAEDVIPASRRDALVEERDWLDYQNSELSRMIEAVEQDPTLAGISGQARRAGQVILGATGDLADLLGGTGASAAANSMLRTAELAAEDIERNRISEDQYYSLFNDPKLSEIDLFQNTLAYSLARARVPDGRLLATVINDAKRDSKITGFTSSSDVVNKLNSIQRQIDSRLGSLNRRIGGDQPQQQPRQSGAEPSIDDLLNMYAPE